MKQEIKRFLAGKINDKNYIFSKYNANKNSFEKEDFYAIDFNSDKVGITYFFQIGNGKKVIPSFRTVFDKHNSKNELVTRAITDAEKEFNDFKEMVNKGLYFDLPSNTKNIPSTMGIANQIVDKELEEHIQC